MKTFKARWLSFSAFAFDLCAVAMAWLLAYVIRFNGPVPAPFWSSGLHALVWVLVIYAVMFRSYGLYRGMWVFASLPDLVRIAKAIAVGALVVMIASALLQPAPIVPRSVLIVSPMLLFLTMGGSRALYRAAKEFYRYGGLVGGGDRGAVRRVGGSRGLYRAAKEFYRDGGRVGQGKPVLVLGAGDAGANLVRELKRSGQWRLVGLLDDDPTKHGREIYGYRVLGSIGDLQKISAELKVEHAIIAVPSASVEAHRRIATLCVRAGVRAMTLPALTQLTQGQAFLSRVRQIDLEDLLGRDPVTIDTDHVEALLKNRVVMVTGAGCSIGSELCRQILRFGPVQLVAFDISEFSIYKLNEELRDKYPEVSVVPIIGDVKDSLLLDQVMARHSPHIVFHAAAYKHVPLMEEVNTWQAVRTNVLGTYRVAPAAIRPAVAHFVMISTAKAVNPTNVMVASKRLAQMAC